MSPISQKSKRIPKHTEQYMQFVKEQTNSKRVAKQRNKMAQKATQEKARSSKQQSVAESVANVPKERDMEEQEGQNADNEDAQRRASKAEAASNENKQKPIQSTTKPQYATNTEAAKNSKWGQFTNEGSQINRSAPQGGSAKTNQRGIDDTLQRNMFDNLGGANFNDNQGYEETPKQVRKDSDTFGKGTATKHNGVSCESIEREKSVCSSNKELVFNKKKSTMSSKKSRKEQNSQLKMVQQQQAGNAGQTASVGGQLASGVASQSQNYHPQSLITPTPQGSQKSITREKIQKMKEIKKYFDQFFKEIKELNKEILNQNEEFDTGTGLPIKSQKERLQDHDELQKLVKKTYDKIHYHSRQIDNQIRLIFTEFNELSLIHESKLGHALRDMQQFLQYYQSRDETIQAILGKLDMLIEIQEKKMQIEIFGENPLDFKTLKKHFHKEKGKSYDSAFGGPKDSLKHMNHRGSAELNRHMMSSEASYSYRMHYGKQPDDQKMTEQDEHNSTCTVENNHQMHDTSSQKRSLKHRKRSFRKLNRKHESSINDEKMKSKRSHRDSMKKPYSKGPSKSALFRGLFNKSSSGSGPQPMANAGLGSTNNYSLRIQNVINQIKYRKLMMQLSLQQQLQQPQNLQNLQQHLLQNFQQQQLPQTQCIILNNGQNFMNVAGNNLNPNQNMMLLNSLHFQKNMMQQMQWRLLGQQLGGNNMPGKQNDMGDKQQDKDGHDMAQQKAAGEEQAKETMADQILKQTMAQAQDEKKDGLSKKQKEAKNFAQMAWTDEALKKLTEQLENSGGADQLNFGDDKHQQAQKLRQHNLQFIENLRQMDPLGNLSQQLQPNMEPLLSQQLSQLQQLNNHLQSQGVADSHQQDEGEYLQQLRQLSKLMEDQQQQSNDIQSCLNGHSMDQNDLQKTLKAALQQRAKHAQQSTDFSPPANDKLNEMVDNQTDMMMMERQDPVNPEQHCAHEDDQAEDSESKCGSTHNKLINSQQLLLLRHLIRQQQEQEESHRLIEAKILGNAEAAVASQGGEGKIKQQDEEQDQDLLARNQMDASMSAERRMEGQDFADSEHHVGFENDEQQTNNAQQQSSSQR